MPDTLYPDNSDPAAAALMRGRSEGMAITALTLGVAAFFNLLGAEKGILAIVFGVLALKGATSSQARLRSRIAIALGVVQVISVAVVLLLFHEELGQALELLKTLG